MPGSLATNIHSSLSFRFAPFSPETASLKNPDCFVLKLNFTELCVWVKLSQGVQVEHIFLGTRQAGFVLM